MIQFTDFSAIQGNSFHTGAILTKCEMHPCVMVIYTSGKKKLCIGKQLYKIITLLQTVILYFRFVTIHIYFPINIVKGYTHHFSVKFQA